MRSPWLLGCRRGAGVVCQREVRSQRRPPRDGPLGLVRAACRLNRRKFSVSRPLRSNFGPQIRRLAKRVSEKSLRFNRHAPRDEAGGESRHNRLTPHFGPLPPGEVATRTAPGMPHLASRTARSPQPLPPIARDHEGTLASDRTHSAWVSFRGDRPSSTPSTVPPKGALHLLPQSSAA
jgi:hypothetical protein